jgi:hypothetical protein
MAQHERPEPHDYPRAQNDLDMHVTVSETGRCIECGVWGPCPTREAAMRIMMRGLWLPVRTPGATRPYLIGARRVA